MNIRKFEEIGTRSGATLAAIGQAIDFHESIGPTRKEARLRYLGGYVLDGLDNVPGIRSLTDLDPRYRGLLIRIVVDGKTGEQVANKLRDEFGIWTYGLLGDEWDGIYIAPNLFNLPVHLDRFADAMRAIAAQP